jgi:hypothetical protein
MRNVMLDAGTWRVIANSYLVDETMLNQDKKSGADRPAAGPTAAEFAEKVLGPTASVAKKKLKGKGAAVMFSYDSARIHTSATKLVDAATGKLLMAAYGFEESQRLLLPPYSPDMHRVIERTHGTAVVMFEKWLYQNPKKCTIEQYKRTFERIYKECSSADAIAVLMWQACHSCMNGSTGTRASGHPGG